MNRLPGFTASSSLVIGLTKGSVNDSQHLSNGTAVIVQADCFTYSRCNGVFKMCTTCCVEAAAGGTIETHCYPSHICGLCGVRPRPITI